MCISVKDGKMVIDNYKTFWSTLTGIVVFIGVAITQCNNCIAFGQDKLVKPAAEEVFDEKIKRYDSTMQCKLANIDTLIEQTELVVELMKTMVSKEDIKTAVREVKNRGRIPIETY